MSSGDSPDPGSRTDRAASPALAGRTDVDLPYRAECWRADALATAAGSA